MKRLSDGTPTVEIVTDDPDLVPPGTNPQRSSWVPLFKYEELMEKFRTINYEYTRLSNAWMGMMSQKKFTTDDVKLIEERGKRVIDIAAKLLPFDPIKLSYLEDLIKLLSTRGFRAWLIRKLL